MTAASPEEALDRQHLETLGSGRAMGKLGAVYAGSRLLGLARELAVAYALGTTAVADRVSGAFLVASATGLVMGEAVFAGAVARIGGARETWERSRLYGEVFGAAARLGVVVSLVYLVAGSAATVALLGTWGDGVGQTVLLSALLAPSVGAYVAMGGLNGWLTIQRRFVLLNGAQVLYSVGTILLLLLAWAVSADLEAEAIVVGWSLGNLAALALLVVLARPPAVAAASRRVRTLLQVGAPLAIGTGLMVTQSVTNRAVAARLETGDVAALGYADRLFLLPVGFVLAVVGPIVLGGLTTAAVADSGEKLGRVVLDQLRWLSSVAVPLNLALAVLAPLAVPLLFEYGAFTETSSARTVAAVNGLFAGIAATAMFLILIRVLQATARYRQLIRLTGIAAAVNLPLSIAGGALLGIGGVALATTLTATLAMVWGIEELGAPFGRRWRIEARRRALVPVTVASAALVVLYIGDDRGLVSEQTRLLAIAVAALCVVALTARRAVLTQLAKRG